MWYHYARLGRLITCCQHDIRVWLSALWYIAVTFMLLCTWGLLAPPHIIHETFLCAKDIRVWQLQWVLLNLFQMWLINRNMKLAIAPRESYLYAHVIILDRFSETEFLHEILSSGNPYYHPYRRDCYRIWTNYVWIQVRLWEAC